VVRTRQVRAITEKYYGRVARLCRSSTDMCEPGAADVTPIPQDVMTTPLRQALSELAPSAGTDDPSTFLITHARIPVSEAWAFGQRLEALSQEFTRKAVPGEKVYGFVAGVYLTDWPDLPQPEEDGEGGEE